MTDKNILKVDRKNMKSAKVLLLNDREETFLLKKNSKGGDLFNSVCAFLNLIERSYFGLLFKDKRKNKIWLNQEKQISKQLSQQWKFELRVRFYPPNPNCLHEELTKYFLCLQLRQDLFNGRLMCSFGVYSLLGAYIIQSELGDFNEYNHHGYEYMKPVRIPLHSNNAIALEDVLQRTNELHKVMRGLTSEEADSMFLSTVRKMCLYGLEMHQVTNLKDNCRYFFGVNFEGIFLHKGFIRTNNFKWCKIIKMSYKKNVFILTHRKFSNKNEIISFHCDSVKSSRNIWIECVEYHLFFRVREIRPIKRNFFWNKRSIVNINLTFYQTQQTLIERQPPNFQRFPIISAPNEDNEYGYATQNCIAYQEKKEIPERLKLPNSFIEISNTDRSDGLVLNSEEEIIISLSKELNDNDVEWKGCRTNFGLSLSDALLCEIEDDVIVLFEITVNLPGIAKFGWSTNNFNFSNSENFINLKCKSTNNYFLAVCPFAPFMSKGDRVKCFLNLRDCTMWWIKNQSEISSKTVFSRKILELGVFPIILLKSGVYKCSISKEMGSTLSLSLENYYFISELDSKYFTKNNCLEWQLEKSKEQSKVDILSNGRIAQSHFYESWQGVYSNFGIKPHNGQYYFEVIIMENHSTSLTMIGWGLKLLEYDLDLGSTEYSWGYGADRDGFGLNGNQGKKMHNDEIENYGKPFTINDVIGCFIDFYQSTFSWSLNGKWFGIAYCFENNNISEEKKIFYPAIFLKDNTIQVNFGYNPFKYPAIIGNKEYLPISEINHEYIYEKMYIKNKDNMMNSTNEIISNQSTEENLNENSQGSLEKTSTKEIESTNKENLTNIDNILNEENEEKTLPAILTKTSYFQYYNDNSDANVLNGNDEIQDYEKRINELTNSIHRRSSGAEGGNVKEITMFKSKSKGQTQATVVRQIVMN